MTTPDYASLFERLFDAVVVSDRYGFINYANPAMAAMLGWSREELVDKPLTVLVPDRLTSAHQAGFARYFEGGQARLVGKRPVQLPAQHRDGREIDIEMSLSEISDAAGNQLIVGFLRDLSERHAFERELKVTAQLRASVEAAAAFAAAKTPRELYETVVSRLQAGFDTVSARIWLVDGEMMHVGAAAGPDDDASFSRTPVSMVSHPFRVAQVARERRVYFSNEPTADPTLDGDWIRANRVGSVAMLPLSTAGRLYGVLTYYGRNELFPEVAQAMEAFAVMVSTALRNAEQMIVLEYNHKRNELLANASKLLGSSLNYEKTMASLADLIVREVADWCAIHVVDENNEPRQLKVAHRDPKMVEIVAELQQRYPLLYTREEGVGRVMHTQASEFIPDITPEIMQMALKNAPARPDDLVIDPAEMRELLEKLDLRSMMTVPLIARGRSIGAITMARSGKAARFTADDLSLAEDLGRRAAYAIDNAQLYGEATESVRVRDHFMGLASHELRTPITVVLGAAQSLSLLVNRALVGNEDAEKIEIDAAKLRSRLRMVDDSSRNLAKMADRMLDVTRLQRGVLQVNRADADLAAVVREVVAGAKLRQQHGHFRDDVAIVEDIPSGEVRGFWDVDRLEQVINNLLDNALKYSVSGGQVFIEMTADSDAARIIVRDEGIGIAADQQTHIFEPFARGANTADNYPGFGMGLALSRSITEMHGGEIGVESAGEGAGSTFWISLPRQAPEESAGEAEGSESGRHAA